MLAITHIKYNSQVCIGVSLCLNVTCAPPTVQCRENGTCYRGNCVYALQPTGTGCNDGMWGPFVGLSLPYAIYVTKQIPTTRQQRHKQ